MIERLFPRIPTPAEIARLAWLDGTRTGLAVGLLVGLLVGYTLWRNRK
jgi:hypothetical protein